MPGAGWWWSRVTPVAVPGRRWFWGLLLAWVFADVWAVALLATTEDGIGLGIDAVRDAFAPSLFLGSTILWFLPGAWLGTVVGFLAWCRCTRTAAPGFWGHVALMTWMIAVVLVPAVLTVAVVLFGSGDDLATSNPEATPELPLWLTVLSSLGLALGIGGLPLFYGGISWIRTRVWPSPALRVHVWAWLLLIPSFALLFTVVDLTPQWRDALGVGVTAHRAEPATLDAGSIGSTAAAAARDVVTLPWEAGQMEDRSVNDPAWWVRIGWLCVGGAVASPVGGVGLFAVGVLTAVALGRPIPKRLVRAAARLLVLWLGVAASAVVLLLIVEPYGVTRLTAAAIGALGQNGMGRELDPDLTPIGRGVLVAALIAGRYLPALALGLHGAGGRPAK